MRWKRTRRDLVLSVCLNTFLFTTHVVRSCLSSNYVLVVCRRGMNGEECSGVGQCYCGRCNCQQNVNGVSAI